jgi:transposase
VCHVGNELSLRLVPDAFWEIADSVLPEFDPRPQGGGTAPADKRAVFTAIVYVLTCGCAWRHLPPEFGVTVPTAHRRFLLWVKAGVFDKIHRAVLDRLGAAGELDWSAAILDAASIRAKRGAR